MRTPAFAAALKTANEETTLFEKTSCCLLSVGLGIAAK